MALCALMLLLTACAGRADTPEARLYELRRSFSDSSALQAHAVVTADYGERVYSYTVDLSGNEQAGTMTVTEPENIAGTLLQWSVGTTQLSVEGVSLVGIGFFGEYKVQRTGQYFKCYSIMIVSCLLMVLIIRRVYLSCTAKRRNQW